MKIFSSHASGGMGWFRLFGWGLYWKDVKRHGYTFGERYGYIKRFKIGKWIIGFLKP